MEKATLIVRMSKTARIFFKSNTYVLKKDGEDDFEMNYAHHTKVYDVLPGTHHIEIGSENSKQTKEVTLTKDEIKTLTINPVAGAVAGHSGRTASLTRTQFVLVLFGLCIGSIIGIYLYFGSIPIPSIFLILLAPFILLFTKNKKNDELGDFQITIKNKAIIN
ncbi:MAG TPA: hypothetical protein VFI78_05480 [Salinimicrobium sp.]|nr:hypothetical protein [Salinimicrobium sp.]